MLEASFDPQLLLGPLGGGLALAFGAGCAAGYAFCTRTIYKLLGATTDKQHEECLAKIKYLERENEALKTRLTILEDRLFHGQTRQLEQIRESSVRVLGEDKLGVKK